MSLPIQFIVGPDQHGVTRYARAVASATAAPVIDPGGIEQDGFGSPTIDGERLHVHFTDRLFGADPAGAADRFCELAGRSAISVTLHDLPQPSDGEASMRRRIAGYRRVVEAARAVATNSRHELLLLREHIDPDASPTVIPLPVGPPALGVPTRPLVATVGVVGFVYPGKGHREAIDAVASIGAQLSVTAFGRVANGHERDLDALIDYANEQGVLFEATGYLSDGELLERCASAAVPLSAHQHVSASGSINTWLQAGRRPLVLESRYAREMSELRPGTLRLVEPHDLAAAIADAGDHPGSTWIEPTASVAPDLDDVARAYIAWWLEVEW